MYNRKLLPRCLKHPNVGCDGTFNRHLENVITAMKIWLIMYGHIFICAVLAKSHAKRTLLEKLNLFEDHTLSVWSIGTRGVITAEQR